MLKCPQCAESFPAVGEDEVIKLIGEGSCGTVYSPHRPFIGKSAAIK